MKTKIYLLILMFSYVFVGFSQYFEGYIKYQIDITSKKKSGVSKVDMLYGVHGKSMKWYIKGNQYKKEYEGSNVILEKIYDPTTNTIHEFTVKRQSYQKKDAGNDPAVIKALPAKPEKIVIKGYECRRADYKSEEFDIEVYYAGKLKLAARSFKDHSVHQLDAIFKKSGIPLKIVYNYKDITVTYRATDIKRIPLSDKTFQLRSSSGKIQTGVKNELDHRLEYGIDSSYCIYVIGWMHHVTNLDQEAEMQFHNDEKHMNLILRRISVVDAKTKGENFESFVEKSEAFMRSKLYDPSIKEIISGPINDMAVKNYEMTGDNDDDDITYYYQYSIIQGTKNYYLVACWTYNDEKGPRVPLMKNMIRSVLETK